MTNRAAVLVDLRTVVLEDRPEPEMGPRDVVVAVRSVGVCGSDVHYYREGRIGDFVVEAPLILGHEAAGVVVAAGELVTRLNVGQRVTIEPGVPDGTCVQCQAGRYNLCPEVRFLATPPVDGAFIERISVPEAFAHPVPDLLSDDAAALIEPLSVAVAACRVAAVGLGSSVLVTGACPIGVLVAQLASCAG
ncbi:MAG: alcohol dehydrogenase catalytic domain-containing protein, partial [Chloroflexi bacterium]|nr:alcohol dehydrogenase catalytic domain-containing protein [Chloroflexota bacterium]